MKIKKNSKKSSKIFELQLLKSKIYNKTFESKITISSVSNITSYLKKMLQLIFKYNQHKKKIWFIGVPKALENSVLNLKNRTFKSLKYKNATIHHNSLINIKNSKDLKQLCLKKINRFPDLIVLFQKNPQTQALLKINEIKKVPVVDFTTFSRPIRGNGVDMVFVLINAVLH